MKPRPVKAPDPAAKEAWVVKQLAAAPPLTPRQADLLVRVLGREQVPAADTHRRREGA